MTWKALAGIGVVASGLWIAACDSETPTTPGTPPPTPSPLTLSAPTVVSPIDGVVVNNRTPTLVLRASAGSDPAAVVSYEIQVLGSAGDVAYSRTVTGGAANGQAMVSHAVETQLARWTTYRWRARAAAGSTTSPWSDATSSAGSFVSTRPDASTSTDEFREYFFDLIAQKNVGPNATQQAMATMEPELNLAGVILAKEVSGFIRGRLYLPTGTADKYTRSVDVVTGFGPGFPWVWVFRGRTVCEGICP
jgi:hypothetical protein